MAGTPALLSDTAYYRQVTSMWAAGCVPVAWRRGFVPGRSTQYSTPCSQLCGGPSKGARNNHISAQVEAAPAQVPRQKRIWTARFVGDDYWGWLLTTESRPRLESRFDTSAGGGVTRRV
jgi:hypothetical protein